MSEAPPQSPPRRWNPAAWPAIVAGVVWLCGATSPWRVLIALVPGCFLVASGISLLLWPGDARIYRCMALGALMGVLMSVPAFPLAGWVYGLAVALLSAGAFVAAGTSAFPVPWSLSDRGRRPPRWCLAVKAAADEALAGYFICFARVPSGRHAQEAIQQLRACDSEGFVWGIDDPGKAKKNAANIETTETLGAIQTRLVRGMRRTLEVVSFDSRYRCPADAPYCPEWIKAPSNARCRLRVFRQAQPGHPWLIGIHGYRMGGDWLDLQLFPPRELVDDLQLNLVLPTLPLHGARRYGPRSGDRFLDGGLLDLCYAESQSLWDLQRTAAWIRQQDHDARIGVLGYSLGGYNAALMAAHQNGLDFVIAGIPVADFASLVWLSLPTPHRRYFEAAGLSRQSYDALLSPVSPLWHAPRLPPERLAIFAGLVDRVVPPSQPLQLSRHWGVPVRWFSGGHLSFRNESVVKATIRGMMASAGWSSHGVYD